MGSHDHQPPIEIVSTKEECPGYQYGNNGHEDCVSLRPRLLREGRGGGGQRESEREMYVLCVCVRVCGSMHTGKSAGGGCSS